MDRETIGIMFEKAHTKKDGIYSFRWHTYLVLNNRMQAYSERIWKNYWIFEPFSGFVTQIWTVDEAYDIKNALNRLIPQFKNREF